MYEIDHIGIAVRSLAPAVERWCRLMRLGPEAVEYHRVEHARMDMAYLPASNLKVELMAPWDEESAIHKFIEKRGEGIHHICFATSGIEADWERVKSAGFPVVDANPRESLGELIAFLHPKGLDGVLIEFKEK